MNLDTSHNPLNKSSGIPRRLAIGALAAAGLLAASNLWAQATWPTRTVRFIVPAPAGTAPDESQISLTPWKTTVVFSELGADHPGALVDALLEFSKRDINLARIESRPARREIGRYRFFIDVEGRADDEQLAEAIEALRTKAESVNKAVAKRQP